MASEQILQLKHWLAKSSRIVVLTGAGMSTESGILDFRSEDGLWRDETLMTSMSEGYLKMFPREFWQFFRDIFWTDEYLSARPNAGHRLLASLEKSHKNVQIFTQNVDGLHQIAGSTDVYELHGNIRRAYCPRCRERYHMEDVIGQEIPRCSWMSVKGELCDSILYPDMVLFEQSIHHYIEAYDAVRHCDLLLILGTSLSVNPVADLPNHRSKDSKAVIINLAPTYYDSEADLVIRGKVGETMEKIMGM
ncbi:NAD-dependent protein deacylase [Alicyclobacillus sp. SO9]|uniref:NAD-dependent protein deacylase n=1 Tax=Alicyclobacillus sp. SO9 TaxID=2665646 RepID=UPI0018E8B5F7|nr:NAD-dependent protein deacylase [Alicyclobacillus sp. SO9]QQE77503.1 NAD-dependent protein deacylase [Alicyclobacillus sp. SO9]